jgi:hypothetical protein
MINYETYCQIRLFYQQHGLNNQIGRELGIDPETAAKYAALATFPRRHAATPPNASSSSIPSNPPSPADSNAIPTAPPRSISGFALTRDTPAA